MRVLLDTHILIWALSAPHRLNDETRQLIKNRENDVMFSAASIWEIAIKARLGRVDFTGRPDDVASEARKAGFIELPVQAAAAIRVADLPLHHRDPFDRLLVAQAMTSPARFYTADALLQSYSELVMLAG